MSQAEQESFLELFRECLTKHPLSLGLARHLLRKALRARTTLLHDVLLDNLEAAVPVLRDVVRYLANTIPADQKLQRGNQILRFCKQSDLGGIPFVRMWILDLLHKCPGLVHRKDAFEYAEDCSKQLGVRPIALMATAYKQVDWVRSTKETWRNNEPWDRRALIWSTSTLPKGERKPFLVMVAQQGDLLDAAVAKHLLSR